MNLNLNITINSPTLCRIEELLENFLEKAMAKFDTILELQNAVNDTTNQTALAVQALIDKINSTPGDGLDGPQTEAVISFLTALKTQQEGILATAGSIPPVPTVPVIS